MAGLQYDRVVDRHPALQVYWHAAKREGMFDYIAVIHFTCNALSPVGMNLYVATRTNTNCLLTVHEPALAFR